MNNDEIVKGLQEIVKFGEETVKVWDFDKDYRKATDSEHKQMIIEMVKELLKEVQTNG